MLVNVTYLLRLFTIYMGKLVSPWFGQLVPKIQDWYISSWICIYYLYKSGILHNLGTPRTSTVRHYWPICWALLIAISVDCRLTCCWTLDRYVGQCIGWHISWRVSWHSIACQLGQLSCNNYNLCFEIRIGELVFRVTLLPLGFLPLFYVCYNVRLFLNTLQRWCHSGPYFFPKTKLRTLEIILSHLWSRLVKATKAP